MRVLVTGGSGFVGRAVTTRLLTAGHEVVATRRRVHGPAARSSPRWHSVGSVDATTDWIPVLSDVDAVIHLVARTHSPGRADDHASAAYRRVNVDGTQRLAEQARSVGVRRVIFVSSVKAQAEHAMTPLTEADPACPEDDYGLSKLQAEQVLVSELANSPTQYTVIRPPLVYGPGVQANLYRLTQVVLAGWPLPFERIDNRRSLIAVHNLADLLVSALNHPAAADRLFLVRDGVDLSTPELVRRIAHAGGRRARFWPIPAGWLSGALRLTGRSELADRLLGSLCIDDSRVRRELGWVPPVSPDSALAEMVRELQPCQPS